MLSNTFCFRKNKHLVTIYICSYRFFGSYTYLFERTVQHWLTVWQLRQSLRCLFGLWRQSSGRLGFPLMSTTLVLLQYRCGSLSKGVMMCWVLCLFSFLSYKSSPNLKTFPHPVWVWSQSYRISVGLLQYRSIVQLGRLDINSGWRLTVPATLRLLVVHECTPRPFMSKIVLLSGDVDRWGSFICLRWPRSDIRSVQGIVVLWIPVLSFWIRMFVERSGHLDAVGLLIDLGLNTLNFFPFGSGEDVCIFQYTVWRGILLFWFCFFSWIPVPQQDRFLIEIRSRFVLLRIHSGISM